MIFSVIIINYKQKEFTIACIKSVQETLKCSYEIIVVNNSPEDDLSNVSGIAVINNQNKGFSQANNLAVKSARGEFLLFLNADTVLSKDFSEEFLATFGSKNFGAVGLGMRYPNGKYQMSYWFENNFINEIKNKKLESIFSGENTDVSEEINIIKEVDWVSGAALIIRKDIFESVKGFDEDYFLFYEDADLCKRIKLKGYKIFYLPFDGLMHYKGENVNKSFLTDTYYHSKKSQLVYYKKHNNLLNRILLRLYLSVKFLFRSLIEKNDINTKIIKLLFGAEK